MKEKKRKEMKSVEENSFLKNRVHINNILLYEITYLNLQWSYQSNDCNCFLN